MPVFINTLIDREQTMSLGTMKLYEDLALEGGGAKGYVYIGVAKALQKLGLLKDMDAISGASAGAISALVLATGWTYEKMKKILDGLDFEKMASGGFIGKITAPITEIREFGLHDGDAFYDFFKSIVKEITGNEHATFEDWHNLKIAHPELGLKDLSIQACNLNTRQNETFAWNTAKAKVPIADAVRASMGFPGYFTPWKIKDPITGKVFLYSDGGIQKNCPSDVFEKQPGLYNPKVLSVKLESFDQIKYFDKGIPLPAKDIKTPLQCAVAQFEAAMNVQDNFLTSPYKQTTILCDTLDVGTLQFDLTDNEKQALEASGVYGVIRYFYQLHPGLVEDKYKDEPETLAAIKDGIKVGKFTECFTEFMKTQKAPAEPKRRSGVKFGETLPSGDPMEANVHYLQPQAQARTPMFHHWCKNPAISGLCDKHRTLEAQHREHKKLQMGH